MKKKSNLLLSTLIGLGSLLAFSACNKTTDTVPEPLPETLGYYVLNKGTGANGSLGFFRMNDSQYLGDYYKDANDGAELGNNPTDMVLYGSKLYIAVNGSNRVVVVDSSSAEILKAIDVTEPRYLKAVAGRVYLTSGTDQLNVIDTSTMSISSSITVGNTPEQLAVINDRIFVVNSGAKSAAAGGDYDNRIAVIGTNGSAVERWIPVAPNINKVVADPNINMLYVNAGATAGNTSTPSKMYSVNTQTNGTKAFQFGAENMLLLPGNANTPGALYLSSSNYQSDRLSVLTLNTSTDVVTNFINNTDIKNPTSMQVLPVLSGSGALAITDAKNGSEAGEVLLFNGMGTSIGKFEVGVNPVKTIFVQ